MEDKDEKTDRGILISPSLVVLDLEASSDLEALEKLAGVMFKQGVVKESYIAAVQEREKNFCTGLPFESMGVALPHTDAVHVNREAVAMGVLKHPVKFREMGTPENEVSVKLIFMLAIQNPDAEVGSLAKMMEVFQIEGCLEQIASSKTNEEAASVFKKFFESAE